VRARSETARGIAKEVAIVCFAAAVYGGVRALTEGSVAQAVANAEAIARLEGTLGIAWEQAAQSLILGSYALTTLANWIYIWGHWPVIIAVASVLYVRRPLHYRVLRNAIIVSGLIGFAFFYFVPTAPPRLVENGLVDTVLEHSHSYRALQPPSLTNQYAAMPSLHFGWNLVVGIVLFAAFTGLAVRLFAVLMPFAMAFAVVATANHYVLDVLVALGVVLAGLGAAIAFERHRGPPAPNGGRP
jgi:membrane-associated phospholipid phosphatase